MYLRYIRDIEIFCESRQYFMHRSAFSALVEGDLWKLESVGVVCLIACGGRRDGNCHIIYRTSVASRDKNLYPQALIWLTPLIRVVRVRLLSNNPEALQSRYHILAT